MATHEGIRTWGIRFNGDGSRGATGLEDCDWRSSTDEELLRGLVRIDVAGNVGELIRGHDPSSRGGLLSQFFPEDGPKKGSKYPSDAINAWDHSGRLVRIRSEKEGREPSVAELRIAMRAIIAEAESDADRILRENSEALEMIARKLLEGPMKGTAIRAILERANRDEMENGNDLIVLK